MGLTGSDRMAQKRIRTTGDPVLVRLV